MGKLLSEKLLDDSYPVAHQTFPNISRPGLCPFGSRQRERREPARTRPWPSSGGAARAAGTLAPVRLTVFWQKMRGQFGDAYAASVAKDYVLTGLGGRTVDQALADGTEPKTVWRAVCEAFEIPEESR